jgi:hypothetical protein
MPGTNPSLNFQKVDLQTQGINYTPEFLKKVYSIFKLGFYPISPLPPFLPLQSLDFV